MADHILYNGTVVLEFDEENHVYKFNGVPVDGVTTVTGSAIDKSFVLMPWAVKMAEEYLLEHWPNDGYVPKNSDIQKSLFEGMKKAHYRKKKQAADVGTEAHKWIEGYIRAGMLFKPEPPKPTDKQARHAIEAYLRYEDKTHMVYKETEKKVFSLKHVYAGTLDIVAVIDGMDTLPDIKTSNSYREEYALQTAGYCEAYNEEHGTNMVNRVILMLPKDGESDVEVIERGPSVYEEDRDSFLAALQIHRWHKRHKKLRSVSG